MPKTKKVILIALSLILLVMCGCSNDDVHERFEVRRLEAFYLHADYIELYFGFVNRHKIYYGDIKTDDLKKWLGKEAIYHFASGSDYAILLEINSLSTDEQEKP